MICFLVVVWGCFVRACRCCLWCVCVCVVLREEGGEARPRSRPRGLRPPPTATATGRRPRCLCSPACARAQKGDDAPPPPGPPSTRPPPATRPTRASLVLAGTAGARVRTKRGTSSWPAPLCPARSCSEITRSVRRARAAGEMDAASLRCSRLRGVWWLRDKMRRLGAQGRERVVVAEGGLVRPRAMKDEEGKGTEARLNTRLVRWCVRVVT